MKLTDDEVRRIADLARLELDDDELRGLREDFASILGFVESIAELELGEETVDGSAAPPPLREDRPRPSLPAEHALRSAPDRGPGHFRVPRVLDE